MKNLYSILICLFLSNFCFAQSGTLYDKEGIKFEYSESIHKSFYCTENGLMYNLVDVQYTISNNSGKLAYVEYHIDIVGLANYAAGCAFKSNKNLDQSSYNLGTGDQTGKISNGDIITGEIGGWIQQGVSPSWNFYTRFYNEASTKPPTKSDSEQTGVKKNTSNKSDYSVRVDQDDLRVNPEDPNKKANELKRIKEQQDLAKQALIQQKQLQTQQAQRQKEIADEKKRQQDEYNRQQEIRAEKLRNEQNLIKENYTNNTNRIASENKEINRNLEDIGNTVWNIIQNGKARKMETGESIITFYAQDLYSKKRDNNYYDNLVCNKCNSTGFEQYDVPSTNVLYGQSHRCSECNGIGKLYKLKNQFDYTFENTHHKEAIDLYTLLLKIISRKTPLFDLYPSNYKGHISLTVLPTIGAYYDDLIIVIKSNFEFYTKNGKRDIDAPIYKMISEKRIFPLNLIQSFIIINSENNTIEGSTYVSGSHIMLVCNNGENFEFSTDEDISASTKELNDLLILAKNVK